MKLQHNSALKKFPVSIGSKLFILFLLIFHLKSFCQKFNENAYFKYLYSSNFKLNFNLKKDISLREKTQIEIQELLSNNEIITNKYWYNDIHDLKEKICRISNIDTQKINIIIIKNHEKNALSFPDGSIILYSGLLQNISYNNELAFVLAHEFSHCLHPEIFDKSNKNIPQLEIEADKNALKICMELGYETQSITAFIEKLKVNHASVDLSIFNSSQAKFEFENRNSVSSNKPTFLHYELNNERTQNIIKNSSDKGFRAKINFDFEAENIHDLLNKELYVLALKEALIAYREKNNIMPLLQVLERYSYFINLKKNSQLTKFELSDDFTKFIEKISPYQWNKVIHFWLLESKEIQSPKNHETLFYRGLLHYYGKYYNDARNDFLYYKNNFKNEIFANRAEQLWREIRYNK